MPAYTHDYFKDEYRVVKGKNPKFTYESNTIVLKMIRLEEKLDGIIKDAKTDWEKIILINDWAHHQVFMAYYGQPFHSLPMDIPTRLTLLRNQITRGFCGTYQTFFIQACLSLDIPARAIATWRYPEGKPDCDCDPKLRQPKSDGHHIADAYDRENKRWILVDPSFNITYKAEKGWLNALDLHRYFLVKRWRKVSIYHPMFGYSGISNYFKKWIIAYFENFCVVMRNNFITDNILTSSDNAGFGCQTWVDGKSKEEDFFWEEN